MFTSVTLFVAASLVSGHVPSDLLTVEQLPYDRNLEAKMQAIKAQEQYDIYDYNDQQCPARETAISEWKKWELADLTGTTKQLKGGFPCTKQWLQCTYDNNSIRFRCANGQWQVLYNHYCILNNRQVPNGFILLSETGCVEAICEAGRVQWNDCSKGCGYYGRYLSVGFTGVDRDPHGPNYGLHYRCDYSGYVTVFNGHGCRVDNKNYQDGFIQTEGTTMIWACENGQVHWLGGKGTTITANNPSGEAILATRNTQTLQAPTTQRKATYSQSSQH